MVLCFSESGFDFHADSNDADIDAECDASAISNNIIRCMSWESEMGDGVIEHSQVHDPCMLPLVKFKKGTFELCPSATDILASLSKPICLCTVFGSPASGKSTLISRSILAYDFEGSKLPAIRYKDDLDSDQSSDAESRSLTAMWMWGRPLSVRRDSGEVVTIVICENGKGDGEWEDNECILFSLSVLLSSHILYNGTSLLDEHKIGSLRSVKQLTRYIRSKPDNQGDEDGIAYREFFPNISWVLRNSVLSTEKSSDIPPAHLLSISSRAYLEKALRVSGYSDEAEQKNTQAIRKT